MDSVPKKDFYQVLSFEMYIYNIYIPTDDLSLIVDVCRCLCASGKKMKYINCILFKTKN